MSRKKKNQFANKVVKYCLAVTTIITAAILFEYHRLGIVIPSGVLGVLVGFWGGELLIVALRQIFGSDVVKKSKETPQETPAADREDSI